MFQIKELLINLQSNSQIRMSIFKSKNDSSDRPEEKRSSTGETGVSIIAAGMTIIGNIESNGNVRIDGRLIGKLVCRSKVTIGAKGRIEGSIDTANALVEGEIQGEIIVRELLQLQESSRLSGDITTVRMAVQDGAVFTGNIKMGKEAKEILTKTPVPNLIPSDNQREAGQAPPNRDKAKVA